MGKRANRRREDKSRRLSPASKPLEPRNPLQAEILEALNTEDQIFITGAAGTGKTYLATAYSANELAAKNYHHLLLIRPAVEAGEQLGFLPGDMGEKMDPYLRPFFDILNERMSKRGVEDAMKDGRIEIAPIGFQRGRTYDNSIILVDEAQNATYAQLKMLLTRVGEDSKVIVTGDHTQTDIGNRSGLKAYADMARAGGIPVFEFGPEHVVRSKICAFWTEATAKWEKIHGSQSA